MNIRFDVEVEGGGLLINQQVETHPGVQVLVSTLYVPDALVAAFAASVAEVARALSPPSEEDMDDQGRLGDD